LDILALDTTSSWGSVALSKNEKIVYLSYLDIRVTHSERLMEQIDYGLKQSGMSLDDIELIAISNGPGSFTGVRIGLATAKGICMAREIPLYPVNTLKLLAYNVYGSQLNILPFIDARMDEVYAALYDSNFNEIISPRSSDPAEFLEAVTSKTIIIGDAVEKYDDAIKKCGKDLLTGLPHQNYPLATTLISIIGAEGVKPQYRFDEIAVLEPYYLRRSQAELKYKETQAEK